MISITHKDGTTENVWYASGVHYPTGFNGDPPPYKKISAFTKMRQKVRNKIVYWLVCRLNITEGDL